MKTLCEVCDDMEAKHTALLYCCETHWLSRAKMGDSVCELKE